MALEIFVQTRRTVRRFSLMFKNKLHYACCIAPIVPTRSESTNELHCSHIDTLLKFSMVFRGQKGIHIKSHIELRNLAMRKQISQLTHKGFLNLRYAIMRKYDQIYIHFKSVLKIMY